MIPDAGAWCYAGDHRLKILRDFWVINTGGIVLFMRVFDKMVDDQLFGGFMSALNSFAMHLEEQGLTSFDLGNKKYIMLKRGTLFFVSNFDQKNNPKKARKELEQVAGEFLDTYASHVDSWNGDTSFFAGFEHRVKDSFEDVVSNFEKSFW